MRKFFVTLSVMFVALTGLLVGCAEDKYADVAVHVSSVTVVSGTTSYAAKYSSEEGAYIVNYGDEVKITCNVTSSADISNALIFRSYNESAMQKISSTLNTVTLKAAVPSRSSTSQEDVKYRVNVASVESNNGNIDLYFKVKLPTTGISLASGLGLTYGENQGISLKDNISFSSSYISDAEREAMNYQVDDTGASFNLVSFTPYTTINSASPVVYSLTKKANGIYFANIDGEDKNLFKITDGYLTVLDSSLEGELVAQAISSKYNSNVSSSSSQSLAGEGSESSSLVSSQVVSVFKSISLDDIEISGAQIFFKNYNKESKTVKLCASLYNNTLASYHVYTLGQEKTYSYNFENVEVTVLSSANFSIVAREISINENGQVLYSTPYALDINTLSAQDIVENINGQSVSKGKKTSFKFSAGTSAGRTYVDFIIKYNFANDVYFSFADMYLDYLQTIQSSYSSLADYEKVSAITFDVSSIPTGFALKQDGEVVQNGSTIDVYDSYASS